MLPGFEKRRFLCAVIAGALVGIAPFSVHAQTDARPAKRESIVGRVSRDEIVREVLARNPGLRASKRRANAIRTEADAERRLPPPQAGVDVWQVPLSKPYDVPGAGMIMVALRQDFTPGRAARAEERERAAAVERTMTDDRSRELAREAGHAFFDYVEASELHRCLLYTSPSPRDS